MARITFLALQALGVALVATLLASMARDPWEAACVYVFFYAAACGVFMVSIAPAAVIFKRWILAGVIGAIVIEVVGGFVLVLAFYVNFLEPKRLQITLQNPEQTVADARKLMADAKQIDRKAPADLPASLRIDHLKFATIYPDHVDLVTWKMSLDNEEGFRIWSATAHEVHHDSPTRYRDVFHYKYNGDADLSPDNMP